MGGRRSSKEDEVGSLGGLQLPSRWEAPQGRQGVFSAHTPTQHLFPEYHAGTITISFYKRGKLRLVK